MAPAAPELLLLGLMHFALARLDIWHWTVLKMLSQNSSILNSSGISSKHHQQLVQLGWATTAAGWIARKVPGG